MEGGKASKSTIEHNPGARVGISGYGRASAPPPARNGSSHCLPARVTNQASGLKSGRRNVKACTPAQLICGGSSICSCSCRKWAIPAWAVAR